MFSLPDGPKQLVNIKVIGVGGAGCNAVDYMIEQRLAGVEYIAANTDGQALDQSRADKKIHLGKESSRGLGAGSDPAKGRFAAEESIEEIREAIDGADLLFITAGMGGGTGTGASPVIAKIAKEMKILTVGVVSMPFEMELKQKMDRAKKGLEELRREIDSIIIISNEKLMEHTEDLDIDEGFKVADSVLYHAVKGIVDLILYPGKINIDFADIRKALKNGGDAMICIGKATGEDRAIKAMEDAINNPLLENAYVDQAKTLLLNITAKNVKMREVKTAIGFATDLIHNIDEIDLKYGITRTEMEEDDMLMITIIATGLTNSDDFIRLNRSRTIPTGLNDDKKDLQGPSVFRKNMMS